MTEKDGQVDYMLPEVAVMQRCIQGLKKKFIDQRTRMMSIDKQGLENRNRILAIHNQLQKKLTEIEHSSSVTKAQQLKETTKSKNSI